MDGKRFRIIKRPARNTNLACFTFKLILLLVVSSKTFADINRETNALLDWAEQTYQDLLPSRQSTQSLDPWLFRFYPETGIYAGVNTFERNVYVLGGPFGLDSPTFIDSLDSLLVPIRSGLPSINLRVISPGYHSASALVWGKDKWVVALENGFFAISEDGQTFEFTDSGFNVSVSDLVYFKGRFVAAGRSGILSSNDGRAWSQTLSASNLEFGKIVATDTFLVGTSSDGLVRSEDGNTWTKGGATGACQDLIWTGSFLACTVGSEILVSFDYGVTWQEGLQNAGCSLNTSCYRSFYIDGSRLVAVGGTHHAWSTDGLNWTTYAVSETPYPESYIKNVVKAREGLYIGVLDYFFRSNFFNASAVFYSVDGVNWVEAKTNLSGLIKDIGVSPSGRILIAGDELRSSIDGLNWPIYALLKGVKGSINWSNDRYLLTEGSRFNTQMLLVSTDDAASWQRHVVGQQIDELVSSAWTGDRYVVVGNGGSILTSKDGSTWMPADSGTTDRLNKIVWINDTGYIIGESGTLLTSKDGLNWTSNAAPTTETLETITSNSERVVIGGDRGTILTKRFDESSWTSSSGIFSRYLSWNGDEFVIFDGFRKQTSKDAITWSEEVAVNNLDRFTDVAVWIGNSYVAAGGSSVLLQSLDAINWERGPTIPLVDFSVDSIVLNEKGQLIILEGGIGSITVGEFLN